MLFEFATPGDILRACEYLDRRIAAATEEIEHGPVDEAFRQAWQARLRRWGEVRSQCGDFGSRMWNSHWSPVLNDWRENQAEWETSISRRTGRAIAPPPPRFDEDPFSASEDRASVHVQIAVVVIAGLALWGLVRSRQ